MTMYYNESTAKAAVQGLEDAQLSAADQIFYDKVAAVLSAVNLKEEQVRINASLESAMTFAMHVRTQMLAHFASIGASGSHATADTTSGVSLPPECTDLVSLKALTSALLTAFSLHQTDAALSSGWAWHIAKEEHDDSLTSTAAPTTLAEVWTRLQNIQKCYDAHDADGTTHTTASVNQITESLYTYTFDSDADRVYVGVPQTDDAISIVLPTADMVNGRMIVVKDESGHAATQNITISTEGSETIDGANTLVIGDNYEGVTLYSDGSNWFTAEEAGAGLLATLLTGFSATVGTVAATDTIISGISKLAGNQLGGQVGFSTTATAAGTTTLTASSNMIQAFTGSTTQTVVLPVTSTLILGRSFLIVNQSTGVVTVNSSGGNAVVVLQGGTSAVVTCVLITGTTAASWGVHMSDTDVTKRLLTGFSSGAGTIAATDSILVGFNKLVGNTQNLTVIGNLLTGYTKGAGTVAATDSILAAVQKLDGNMDVKVTGPAGVGGDGNLVLYNGTGGYTIKDGGGLNAAVTGQLITGFTSGAGVVAGTDTILQAINKLDGNVAATVIVANAALPSASFTDAAVSGKLLTGYAASAGTVAATDSILGAINKLAANDSDISIIRKQNVTDASLAAAVAFTTSIRTTLLAHFASTGSGTGAHAAADTVSGAGISGATITDLATAMARCGEMLTAYGLHDDDAELGAAWAYHLAQEAGDHSLSSAVTPTTLAELFTRLADLQTKLNDHDSDDTAHDVQDLNQSTAELHEYTVTATDQIVYTLVQDSTFSIIIPSALLVEGRTLTVKGLSGTTANDITISTEGSEKIDGQDTYVLDTDYESVTLWSEGTHWYSM